MRSTLPIEDFPLPVVEKHRLRERVYDRTGLPEVQFHWWHQPTLLPVRLHGRLEIIPWGCHTRRSPLPYGALGEHPGPATSRPRCHTRRSPLPYGGWVPLEHVESGLLAGAKPEAVVIPAAFGHHRGMWFLIARGIRGIVIGSRSGPVVYMLTAPSTNYFRTMTEQSPTMPVLVDQVI